ncbi:MAG TPA: glycosyltransferase family 4 protein [Geminicoccus sp.]|uniref:glycosyltransferase family 4 protein n=1 Tax=Geminicoccus sp. TaxID=2024832 RepID=UPI002E370E3C|nr:glycosyltransferase family 4 protein [Geminicoccus sp.]HEX2526557.1 glycosyltransferase family 4 protein [Geminicoccus sp.]
MLAALTQSLSSRYRSIALAPALNGQPLGQVTSIDGLPIHHVAAGSRKIEKALELLDPRAMPRSLRTGYYRRYFEHAGAVLARVKPDLVHVMSWAQAGPVLARQLPDVPLLLHLHDDMLTRLDPEEATGRLDPFAAVVTCSQWLADSLRRHVPGYRGEITAIGNGIDPTKFARGPEPERARGSRLLMVGRISPEKGPHVLIDAFVRLASAHPGLMLDLVGPVGFLPLSQARFMSRRMPPMAEAVARLYGSGPAALWGQLARPGERLKERLLAGVPVELRDRIRFLGPQPHDALNDIYRHAGMLIQPSVWKEAYGMPVAEAMAAGLPVIASADGGLCDLVEHGKTGVLVPPGDAAALASAIASLLADPVKARAYGMAGRRKALELLTWEVAARRLEEVYENLLARSVAPEARFMPAKAYSS